MLKSSDKASSCMAENKKQKQRLRIYPHPTPKIVILPRELVNISSSALVAELHIACFIH
jgi:hypothetical protein